MQVKINDQIIFGNMQMIRKGGDCARKEKPLINFLILVSEDEENNFDHRIRSIFIISLERKD